MTVSNYYRSINQRYGDAMPSNVEDDAYAELADLILNIGRLIRLRTPAGPEVTPLTTNERQVMRVVDLFPGSSPTEIARRTKLQRTNVSTALRGLESKGMITRSPAGGRSVSVEPTDLAVKNLGILRAEWSRDLSTILPGKLPAVRHCNDLLRHLELSLTGGN